MGKAGDAGGGLVKHTPGCRFPVLSPAGVSREARRVLPPDSQHVGDSSWEPPLSTLRKAASASFVGTGLR